MFGQDDNQQTNQVPDDALSARLADPLPTGGSLGDSTNSNNPPFGPPPNNGASNAPFGEPTGTLMTNTTTPPANDLLAMKQQALQQLSPLVGQLDQSPEEKFRTTMMMIQAADDQSLLPVAYETAQKITDEKIRAQALLDVVNEINYFTQQNHSN